MDDAGGGGLATTPVSLLAGQVGVGAPIPASALGLAGGGGEGGSPDPSRVLAFCPPLGLRQAMVAWSGTSPSSIGTSRCL